MYLLGHLGFIFMINHIIESIRDIKLSSKIKLFLGIGAMFPDLIDKSIGSFIFNNGRWIGHSLLFLTSVFLFLILIQSALNIPDYLVRRDIYIFYFASIGHLILDLPGITKQNVFWPIFGSFPPGTSDGFLYGIESTRVIIFELVGLVLFLIIGIREKWSRDDWLVLSGIVITYLSTYSIFYVLIIGI